MSPAPDFLIIGLERSGTHWVTALLNSHPEIAAFPWLPFHSEPGKNNIGEVHLFDTLAGLDYEANQRRFARPFTDFLTKYNKVFVDLVPLAETLPREELYARFKERYNEYCQSQKGSKKIVGESTPAYVLYLDMVDSFYPGIKKICIIRDPKDRIVSWHFNQIRKGRKSADEPITDDFARDYAETRMRQEYQALLDYPGTVHCLTYEALSERGVETTRGLLEYLGVSADAATIGRMLDEASFKNVSARDSGSEGRERGVEDATSHLRKGVVGDWKKYMTQSQGEMVDSILGGLQNKVFDKFIEHF